MRAASTAAELMPLPCQCRSYHRESDHAGVGSRLASCWGCWLLTVPLGCQAVHGQPSDACCVVAVGVCPASLHGASGAAAAPWNAAPALLLGSASLALTQTCMHDRDRHACQLDVAAFQAHALTLHKLQSGYESLNNWAALQYGKHAKQLTLTVPWDS